MPTPAALPADYVDRLYAGVLGKIIGVYLGRPFEQWSHKDIVAKFGEVDYYVHEKLKVPLVVTDDDISGTFTFIRALEDNASDPRLSAEQIGHTWLNYIIKHRAILWWGGMGVSTEHTAYQRLVDGIPAPRSGSIELNGPVVAEQIGSQIFIDGWGLVNPGDPERAAHFAGLAASVSHDGEAIHGAVVVAAMVAAAFSETNLDKLLDTALSFVPRSSLIHASVSDLRDCRVKHDDWRRGLELIHRKYSYELFGGGCHMIPNHAVIQLGLLWGGDSFQRSQMIANTAGYDTDCNAGNVGCINGVRLGLAGLDAGPDFRGPVADRMLLPTADGGGCVSDAATQTFRLARVAARLRGATLPVPKSGARFHFALPGSVQGFTPEHSPESAGACTVGNELGNIRPDERELTVWFKKLAGHRVARAATQLFVTAEQANMGGYTVLASPTAYPGQTATAEIKSCGNTTQDVVVRLYARHYTANDELARVYSAPTRLAPGAAAKWSWTLPETGGHPYMDVGVEIACTADAPSAVSGAIFLDHLDLSGTPTLTLAKPADAGNHWHGPHAKMWFKQWVNAADNLDWGGDNELLRIAHNTPGGLALAGHAAWTDYTVSTQFNIHLAARAVLCARVGGLRRYYALALVPGENAIKLVSRRDDTETVVATAAAPVPLYKNLAVSLTVSGPNLSATLTLPTGEKFTLTATDSTHATGGIAVGVDSGRVNVFPVTVTPV